MVSRAGCWSQPSSDDDSIEAMRRASDSYRDERNAWRSDARERSAMVEALEEINDLLDGEEWVTAEAQCRTALRQRLRLGPSRRLALKSSSTSAYGMGGPQGITNSTTHP